MGDGSYLFSVFHIRVLFCPPLSDKEATFNYSASKYVTNLQRERVNTNVCVIYLNEIFSIITRNYLNNYLFNYLNKT
jgi:hypothetical protein